MTQTIDISYRNGTGLARELSNLVYRPFTFRGHHFASMEGFLQSIKVSDPVRADELAKLYGGRAFVEGQMGNAWKETQTLHFDGETYARSGKDYPELLTWAYYEQLKQNPEFVEKLRASTGSKLAHTMGKNDPTDTVLTQREYIILLDSLRHMVLNGGFDAYAD